MKRFICLIISIVCIGVLCACLQTSESKKPVTEEKAIKMAQRYIKTDKKLISNFNNPSITEQVGYEGLVVLDIRTYEYVSSSELAGRELYVIRFGTEDADSGPILVYVDKYKGVVLGTCISM